MVAYSFKKRFNPPILAGIKNQTIRAHRKRHARPGEEVQLFTGMRTKHCRLLGRPRCESALAIRITFPRPRQPAVIVIEQLTSGFDRITGAGLDDFARSDGFDDFDDMFRFWMAEHPPSDAFEGVLIRWTPLVPADALDIAARAA